MPDFKDPSFVTAAGTLAIVAASPSGGLQVRTRSAFGAESSSVIPADVALAILDDAEQLRAALKDE